MSYIKRSLITLSIPLLFASVSVAEPAANAVISARQTETGALARVEQKAIKIEANIKEIDHTNRKVTVQLPSGDIKTFKVSSKVQRFAEFKKGDQITVEHFEALAYEVRKPLPAELANPRIVLTEASKNKLNLPPGAEAGMISHTIVTIDAIDLDKELVTIKLPEGEKRTIKARVPENLKRVKVGDTVAVTLMEAVAISLDHKKS